MYPKTFFFQVHGAHIWVQVPLHEHLRIWYALCISLFNRTSCFFCRVTDIIQGMVNNGMSVSAAGLACAFGLEDNLSPLSLLASYVQEVNRTGKEMRRRQQCSYVSLVCLFIVLLLKLQHSLCLSYYILILYGHCDRLKQMKNK